MRTKWIVLLLVVFAEWMCSGCAGKEVRQGGSPDNVFGGAPEWVTKGCAAYWRDKEKDGICGRGIAEGSTSLAMLDQIAVARARTEIARSLNLRVQTMLKDYIATTKQGDRSISEQDVTSVSRQITDITLSGTRLADSWLSKDGKTYFVLVILNLEGFKNTVNNMKQLSADVREAIKEQAGEKFKGVDEQAEHKGSTQY